MDEMNRGRTAPPPKKRPNLLVRFLAFLVTLALVLGAVFLVVNYDKVNFDFIKRWFAYRNLARSESGQSEAFLFEGGASASFAVTGGDLLACSPAGIRIYGGDGRTVVEQPVSMEAPVVQAAGASAMVYDVGGRDLYVYRDQMEIFALNLEEGKQIISASLNQQGALVVVTQESGYKANVTVYGQDMSPRIGFNLSSRFVMDAALSPDGRRLALVSMGLDGDAFESRVDVYELDRTAEEAAPDYTCSLGGGVVLALSWADGGIWALGETSLSVVSPDGTLSGACDHSGLYLKNFSLDGSGTAVLLLGKYRAGTSAELRVVSSDGSVRASLPMEEQVLSVSAAGRYIGVLTADRLDIYDQDLEIYHTLNGTQSAQKVLQRPDGSAVLIDSTSARVYVPQ